MLPHRLEADLHVLGRSHPFAALDDAALTGRHDLAARHIDGRHAGLAEHLGGDAGLAALAALEVIPIRDRTLEPAQYLVGDRGHRNRNHIALELVLIEFAVELESAAVIDPAHVIHHVHAERATRRRAEQRRGALLADPIGCSGVAAVDHLLVDGVEHFEGGHDGAGRGHFDLEAPAGHGLHALGPELEVLEDQA